MPEIPDYSGPFDPNFRFDMLNKDALLRLLREYGEYMVRIDGFWYLEVMKRCGNDLAFDIDVTVWVERLLEHDLKLTARALNIQGNDVPTVMKYIQSTPWNWAYQMDIDVKGDDLAVVTYRTCPTLVSLEREGTGREKLICRDLDVKLYSMIAEYFNPKIKVTGLKVPPRTDYSDCCCQWEYRLEK